MGRPSCQPDGRVRGGWGACDGARVHALVLLVGVPLRFLEEVGRGGVELPVEHLASGGRNQAAVRCQWGSGGGSGGGSRGGSGGPLGRWQWLGQARQEGRPRLPARAQLGREALLPLGLALVALLERSQRLAPQLGE